VCALWEIYANHWELAFGRLFAQTVCGSASIGSEGKRRRPSMKPTATEVFTIGEITSYGDNGWRQGRRPLGIAIPFIG
jgi:hypothetical protein